MSRTDIKVKRGTRIILKLSDGTTVKWEPVTDTDIDHLYDTIARLELMETDRTVGLCPQPCEHLSQEDAREGRTCSEHPCTCGPNRTNG